MKFSDEKMIRVVLCIGVKKLGALIIRDYCVLSDGRIHYNEKNGSLFLKQMRMSLIDFITAQK